ncbi:MAG: sulfatase-like hydrolase/transferase [Planctomycetes bacterium]|jgi:arylsulfatase A-like enzyme|nr:sulfatase-like hydrolase/transferase [Planctomycetota bacterium]MBT4029518.1 sulfatase-like hydrolase/transferase [Planctomycetota bacterium]MBT4560612.1 sulfatase-like hydrolase/transferase [Planctomycetota bacterium]MBT5119552.1 sulfatase-like hydrolase/transferase [Planctomycetota bacterium]MBT7317676.1 sulfatase-like hydrolase/transferase [Planctomycetota bacterium]
MRDWIRHLFLLLSGAGLIAVVATGEYFFIPQDLLDAGVLLPVDVFIAHWYGNAMIAFCISLLVSLLPFLKFLRRPHALFHLGCVIGLIPLALSHTAVFWFALILLVVSLKKKVSSSHRLAFIFPVLLTLVSFGLVLFNATSSKISAIVAFDVPVRADAVPEGPDIVLISFDTFRADALFSDYPLHEGETAIPLPHFQRLREQGLWATHALSSGGQTVPGHVGMLTGLDSMSHGVRFNEDPVPQGLTWLAERFTDSGWNSAAVISNGLLSPGMGFGEGFALFDINTVPRSDVAYRWATHLQKQTWLGLSLPKALSYFIVSKAILRPTRMAPAAKVQLKKHTLRGRGRVTTNQVFDMMSVLEKDVRPYFLFVNYMDAHQPYGAPDGFRDRIVGHDTAPVGGYAATHSLGMIDLPELRRVQKGLASQDPAAIAAAEYAHRNYAESVLYLDSLLGEILAKVEANGRPTVILLTGDHGEHFGEHGLMLHANSLYHELLAVPFVLWGDGVPARGQIENDVYLRDVAPTLAALAGLPMDGLEGVAVQYGAPNNRSHISADGDFVAVRKDGWLLLGRWVRGAEPEAIGLYHTAIDPAEQDNLLGKVKTPESLHEALIEGLARDKHTASQEETPDWLQERLTQLGYVDDSHDH